MKPSDSHPYAGLPDSAFWKTAVTMPELADFDPVTDVPFKISAKDRVATAGSCFAQHISRALLAENIRFVQTEIADGIDGPDLPVYSARYGNIYTCRQLFQLFERAYGLFAPRHVAWRRPDGRYVDPFRPNEFPRGFATADEVAVAGRQHLAAVRTVFETCDVLVFTLGLTEVWLDDTDGSAVPLPPGVVASPADPSVVFSPTNLSVDELSDDLLAFIDAMRRINPRVRFVLTVSPVPIIATFEQRHVIVSSACTKAVLRVVADRVSRERRDVLYFPSYEMIVTHPKARYFDANDRAIKAEGVAAVMKVFRDRILDRGHARVAPGKRRELSEDVAPPAFTPETVLEAEFKDVVCDETMLVPDAAA